MSEKLVAVFSGGGTGGHLYPALALSSALEALRPDVRSVFVGATRGVEARVLPEKGVEHLLLPVRGVKRGGRLSVVAGAFGVVPSLSSALARVGRLFRRLRPRLVVVTGGYAGGPAGLMAGMMGIRLALQEQNSVPGVTTKVLSLWARQIHLAFPEAVEALPSSARKRARVTGNPVRPPEHRDRVASRRAFGLDERGTVVLAVGGSQGAAAVNDALMDAVRRVADGELELPDGLQLLWATGPSHERGVAEALEGLGSPPWVRAVGYIDDMPGALASADVAVSRAGAMATSEFLAWGVPAILVPLPTAASDHQTRNAAALAASGAALHLAQQELDGASLWGAIVELVQDDMKRDGMSRAALERGRPRAATEIAAALAELLPPPAGGNNPTRDTREVASDPGGAAGAQAGDAAGDTAGGFADAGDADGGRS
ncbi:MAG: UDP-N-acetylglucosamine--N-acetylmuramyl-(pentapeptide) pyrophosphoryl-undecaprenol N-acetylglucosamine transferase [Gemmatimonadota bacterium]